MAVSQTQVSPNDDQYSPIHGVYAAAVTPRRPGTQQIDLAASLDVIDFLNSHSLAGIVLQGSTGEFPHYDFEDRVRLAAFAGKRSRIPVLVSVAHSTLDGAVLLAREAAAAGAAGVVLMPPHYFRYEEPELRAYYLEFAAQVQDTPKYLYNIPFFTNPLPVGLSVELLAAGAYDGIKDSSGDMAAFETLKAARANRPFALFVGNDTVFLKARSSGADGVVSGCAEAVPELMLGLERAALAGDTLRATALDTHLQQFIQWLLRFPVPVGIKAALAERGVPAGPLAAPLAPATLALLEEFRQWFRQWLPGILNAVK